MDEASSSLDSGTLKISLPWTWRPVKRRMLPGCDLFREGDAAMCLARKLIPLEDDPDDSRQSFDETTVKDRIPCSVWGCNQAFTSLLSYENHYKSAHRHTCLTCHRTFPSPFLLDLHIQENHDPLFAVMAARQDTLYRCLVESCSVKFPEPDARRQHMIKTHSYPANFRFHRLKPAAQPPHRKKAAQSDTASGAMDVDSVSPSTPQSQADARSSSTTLTTAATTAGCLSQTDSPSSDKENAAAAAAAAARTGGEEEEEAMEAAAESEKAVPPRRIFVHKVPQNFSFGHGVARGFQRPPGKKKAKKKGGHWHQRARDDGAGETTTNIENVDMKDMVEALNEAS